LWRVTKTRRSAFFGRNFLIRNAMEEDVQEKSRESHAIARDKKQEVGAQSPEPPDL
jgi:hypothetical protein